MDPKTIEHLALAARNRDLARSLLVPGQLPQAAEWAAVVAFYAAVHLVNAYAWEMYGQEPADHGERGFIVRTDPVLVGCRREYRRLADNGYHARYTLGFRISDPDARVLVDVHLAQVEAIVRQALNLPPTGSTTR